jgi:hypothetical protein
MAQEQSPQDRRRRPRVKLDGGLVANVQTVLQAPIIDLSVSGALIEIEEALRPSNRCTVRLPVGEDQTLRLTARVMRSVLVSLAREGDAGSAARYQVALEFVDLSDESAATLNAYLGRVDGAVSAEIVRE